MEVLQAGQPVTGARSALEGVTSFDTGKRCESPRLPGFSEIGALTNEQDLSWMAKAQALQLVEESMWDWALTSMGSPRRWRGSKTPVATAA